MKNTLHTSGPWAINTCNENGPSLDSFYLSTTAQTWDGNEEERIICRFPTGTGQFSDMGRENLANARLRAAAPDLLDALRGAVAYSEMEGGFHTPPFWYTDAKCLIEKLGGEA